MRSTSANSGLEKSIPAAIPAWRTLNVSVLIKPIEPRLRSSKRRALRASVCAAAVFLLGFNGLRLLVLFLRRSG